MTNSDVHRPRLLVSLSGLLFALCIGGCASFPWGGLKYEAKEPYGEIRELNIPLPTGTPITVRNPRGRVRIVASPDPTLSVFAEIIAFSGSEEEANQRLDEIDLRLEEEFGAIVLQGGSTVEDGGAYEIHLHITVPNHTRLNVKALEGAITALGPFDSCELATNVGDIVVSGVRGNLLAAVGKGKIDAARITGSVIRCQVDSGGGSLMASRAERVEMIATTGSFLLDNLECVHLLAHTQEGTIQASNVAGEVELITDRGALQAHNITGEKSVLRAGIGDVTLIGTHGVTWVETGSGFIHVDRSNGTQLDLRSGAGSMEILNSSGRLVGVSESGDVTVTQFRGDVDLQAKAGPLIIDGDLGRVRARTGSGSISLSSWASPAESAGKPVDWVVETSFGPIDLQLPNSPDLTLQAVTNMGRIKVNVPSGLPETASQSDVRYRFGKGVGRVEAKSGGGLISVWECPGGDLNPHSQ